LILFILAMHCYFYSTDVSKIVRYKKEINNRADIAIPKFFMDAVYVALSYFDYLDILVNDTFITAKNDTIKFSTALMSVDLYEFDEFFANDEFGIIFDFDEEVRNTIISICKYSNNVIEFYNSDYLYCKSSKDDNNEIMSAKVSKCITKPYSKIFDLSKVSRYMNLFDKCVLSDYMKLSGHNLEVLISEKS